MPLVALRPVPAPTATYPEPAPPRSGDPPDDLEDRRLVALVCRHELAAFEALYRRYHPRLSRFLQRMLRPSHLVEEVLNDTLFVVWNQAERYNGTSKVSTWVFAIAYRKALKALDRHDEPVEDCADDEDGAQPGDAAATPEARMSLAQLRSAIQRALVQLSPDQRAAVELTYFHGFSYPEIAAIVDCPTDTVKTRMFHARRRLKSQFVGALGDWL